MSRRRCLLFALLAAGVMIGSSAKAQEAPPAVVPAATEKEQIQAALQLTKEAAARYEFTLGDDPVRPELLAEPVLKWSNPSVGEIHGNVFLWTLGGRPAVVSSIFKWFSPHTHMSHEFHSLSEQPLRARFEGKEVWVSSEPGLAFGPLPEAPAPAAGKPQRLLQMRELSKACAATKRDRDGSQSELRLLTQPVYRYAKPEEGLIDGAIFTMVQGTDPELFLLLEARESGGKPQWLLAATRMNSVAFELRYRDKPIWSVEVMPWSDVSSHQRPYTSFLHKMP